MVNSQEHNFCKLHYFFQLKKVNNFATVCGFNLFQLLYVRLKNGTYYVVPFGFRPSVNL